MAAKRTTLQILQDEQRQYKMYQAELKALTNKYNIAYGILAAAQANNFAGYTQTQANNLRKKVQVSYNKLVSKQNQIIKLTQQMSKHDCNLQAEHHSYTNIKFARSHTGSRDNTVNSMQNNMRAQQEQMRRVGML